jgi:hypothetical protein
MTGAELAAALGTSELAVLGIVAGLMVRRRIYNCLVGDGGYSGG